MANMISKAAAAKKEMQKLLEDEEKKKQVITVKESSKIIKKSKKVKKSRYKPIKETYAEIKESLKVKPNENAFSDTYEEDLKKSLFKGESITINQEESDKPVKKRSGLWDYVLEDEIEYFDPECSYELTKYRPITETKGLDFKPEWFTETGKLYTETGYYTEYPPGSKPYSDFWMEQLRRCSEGYEVNGYRITPDHYFFLNFYRMNIVDESKKAASGDTEGFPKFLAEQYKFFHYFEMCEHLKKDVVALKSRGIE